LLHFS
jgi:hypothetical protein